MQMQTTTDGNQRPLWRHADMALYAVIVAGGSGLRMGASMPKQFLPVRGVPILMRAMARFRQFDAAMNIILVLPESQQQLWRELCREHRFAVQHTVVGGGATRFESSRNGLAAIPAGSRGLVAIHDGVRPFVSLDTIERCFAAAAEHGAAIPVMPVVDTLRYVGAEGEARNVLRSDFRVVQTPQVFSIDVARQAFQQPYCDAFTDDASVVERAGQHVCMVEGNRENVKITTPFDLVVADALAREDGRG